MAILPPTVTTSTTFGEYLKFLRRREQLTQLELSIAVGYSEAQISRLEKNQRLPDLAALKALFIPALHLEQEPELRRAAVGVGPIRSAGGCARARHRTLQRPVVF